MQLYMAIAGMAVLFAALEIVRASPQMAGSALGYRMMEFVDILNSNIMNGNSSFVAYLPAGLCNSTVRGNWIDTEYGAFSSVSDIHVRNQTFCPDQTSARLYLSENESGYVEVLR